MQFRRAAASNSHATSATVESTRSSRETRRGWPLLSAHQITRGPLLKWIGKGTRAEELSRCSLESAFESLFYGDSVLVYRHSADNTGWEVCEFGTVGARLEPRRHHQRS